VGRDGEAFLGRCLTSFLGMQRSISLMDQPLLWKQAVVDPEQVEWR
jgi:hypothetical protein